MSLHVNTTCGVSETRISVHSFEAKSVAVHHANEQSEFVTISADTFDETAAARDSYVASRAALCVTMFMTRKALVALKDKIDAALAKAAIPAETGAS